MLILENRTCHPAIAWISSTLAPRQLAAKREQPQALSVKTLKSVSKPKVSGPRGIGEILKSSDIARLKAEADERRALAASVRGALPGPESDHVVSASVDAEGRLVVCMDSAAWAARVRYATGRLLGLPIRVRVAAPGETPSRADINRRPPG